MNKEDGKYDTSWKDAIWTYIITVGVIVIFVTSCTECRLKVNVNIQQATPPPK